MIRPLCTFLVLACVAGLSGVFTGHVWNRFADENGLLRLGGIYQRIAATGAGLVEITQGYAAPATRSQLRPGASPFEE
jgi:xanthine/uracil permease